MPQAPAPVNSDAERQNLAIRVVLLPRDTNGMGTIFGGIILSYIDQAGAVEAARFVTGKLVTVSLHEVVFHYPVFVGDLVSFYADVVKVGRTSITTRVVVEAERRGKGRGRVTVTEATVVYVHVDEGNRPIPVDLYPGPGLAPRPLEEGEAG
ncbi:MAG: acyl-CoA thioesterase [Acidobacteriota bacterium]